MSFFQTASNDPRGIFREYGFRLKRTDLFRLFLTIIFLQFGSPPLCADSISVSGDPRTLVINTASAGLEPECTAEATTTYSVATTPAQMRITGSLNSNMPANVTLHIMLQAPAGGDSSGMVQLTAVAKDLVTNMSHHTNQGGLAITYQLSATVQAGVISSSSRTVTFTLADHN
ncbi:MAG: hypothetical protein JW746_05580 [Candidatus Krumholzibacteriota bacterium]|nr:hypothetical protein [Candidatus Krumholzibacteriota bacterium]